MTRLFALLAMALLLAPHSARANDEALTLRDVIELHRSGLGDELLMAVIEAAAGGVRLSYADIQDLKSGCLKRLPIHGAKGIKVFGTIDSLRPRRFGMWLRRKSELPHIF